jgi:small-conductance mechanosensitive channel
MRRAHPGRLWNDANKVPGASLLKAITRQADSRRASKRCRFTSTVPVTGHKDCKCGDVKMRKATTEEIIYTCLIIGGGLLLYQLIFAMLKRWGVRKKKVIPSLLTKYIYYPGLFLMLVISLWLALGIIERHFKFSYYLAIRHGLKLVGIAACSYLIIRTISLLAILTLQRYTSENPLDYSLRKAKTKFQLIERVLNVIIVVTALAVMLMTFKDIRQIGSTLLASAGLLGLIIGFAAQKSLSTLFAGIQIAIAQPIRLDDSVVVENQFGTIGEITLTYVVVNTWDGRRLVVPINYFLEKPFENWTRVSPEVIGKLKIHADYTLPVDEIRKVFHEWLEDTSLWDGRTSGLAVTDANESTMQIRLIMSARNSGDAYDLECLVREKLISYIQQHYPHCLPRHRIELKEANKGKEIQ